jgi:hypothetical protein
MDRRPFSSPDALFDPRSPFLFPGGPPSFVTRPFAGKRRAANRERRSRIRERDVLFGSGPLRFEKAVPHLRKVLLPSKRRSDDSRRPLRNRRSAVALQDVTVRLSTVTLPFAEGIHETKRTFPDSRSEVTPHEGPPCFVEGVSVSRLALSHYPDVNQAISDKLSCIAPSRPVFRGRAGLARRGAGRTACASGAGDTAPSAR